jgi:hypothetical protein
VGVLLFAFFVVRGCQEDQLRLTEQQAIAAAREEVEFEPERTQIRFLRQGLNAQPTWIVSLSIPGERENTFRRLAVVRINANSGKVESVAQR